MKASKPRSIGWREWVSIPELDLPWIKAKVDTGARSSALHAFHIEYFQRRGKRIVRFKVHPVQRDSRFTVEAEAELADQRYVRSSIGHKTFRPVIRVVIDFMGQSWPIELTLVSRDEMGFRMLLGRQAIRNRFLVDPGRSFVGGKPPKSVRKELGIGGRTKKRK